MSNCPKCHDPRVSIAPPRKPNPTGITLRIAGGILMLIGILTACIAVGFILFPIGLALWLVGHWISRRMDNREFFVCEACGLVW